MEGEGETGEEALGQQPEWTSHTYQGQELNNVVHIIVPDLTCIPQGQHNDAIATALGGVTANGNVVGGVSNPATLTIQDKDPLSALAAAAVKMDQVEQMMDVKYQPIASTQEGVAATTSHDGHGVVVTIGNVESSLQEEKLAALQPLPMPLAPFLSPEDPDINFYNEVYHYLKSSTFPEGASDVYKKVIKKRATNYLLNEDGSLSYGLKVPKEVITCAGTQREILEAAHVDDSSGVHFGVKKMYKTIFSKYYWRSMYVDVTNYCRSCNKCNEVMFTGGCLSFEEGHRLREEDIKRITTLPTDRVMRVWKKVQVKLYGPYNTTVLGNELLATIVDPFSHWILSQPIPDDNVPQRVANFVFESFCNFGFAQCQVVGMSVKMFEAMQMKYKEKFDAAQDILRTLVPFDSEDAQQSFMFTLQEDSVECAWAGLLVLPFPETGFFPLQQHLQS